MRITLIDAGKRFNRDWIFRKLSYEFRSGHSYAITGPNGSGKSTLLQAIGGSLVISEGKVKVFAAAEPGKGSSGRAVAGKLSEEDASGQEISTDQVFRHVSIAAPYLELIEEMTAGEFLHFHQSFKSFLPSCSIPDILRRVGLEKAVNKQIRYFSSGMKQRLKLAQAIFSDTSLVLLDEPCTNLDAEGIALYRSLVGEYSAGRLVVVSSNDLQEYDFCEHRISILDYK